MALKDQIHATIVQEINKKLNTWRAERTALLAQMDRVLDLDALIAEAEAELATAQDWVSRR